MQKRIIFKSAFKTPIKMFPLLQTKDMKTFITFSNFHNKLLRGARQPLN